VPAVIESMTGARFVHDTLEEHGWEVLVAVAQKVKGLAPLRARPTRSTRGREAVGCLGADVAFAWATREPQHRVAAHYRNARIGAARQLDRTGVEDCCSEADPIARATPQRLSQLAQGHSAATTRPASAWRR
jgi:hypothetical protein